MVGINRISEPRNFFAREENRNKLEQAVNAVRNAFGRPEMDYDDIYQHLVSSEILYLLENGEKVLGMAAYETALLSGIPSLIVEGIAIEPEIQARGIFREVTDLVSGNKSVVCLRTQNPHMYRALQKYCSYTYPSETNGLPTAVKAIRGDLAAKLGCDIDENGVIRGYYGGLFYGKKPYHPKTTQLLEGKLGLSLENGDGLLVVGIR